jgi:ABC-type amino acid transport system permease subunit
MKRRAFAFAMLASLTIGSVARADDYPTLAENTPPANGLEELYAGIALGAAGALMFASAPICKTGVVNPPEQASCFTTSFVAGTPLLVLSIPLLIYGIVQHGNYVDWSKRHPTVAGLSFAPSERGGALSFAATF